MQARETFLIFCLAHLATDFLLQSDAMVKAKKQARARAYAVHGAIHYAAIAAVTAVAHPAWLIDFRYQAAGVALIAAHLWIDLAKERLTAKKFGDNVWIFLADQGTHLATIVAAALLFTRTRPDALWKWLGALEPHREKILVVLVVYFGVVFAGGYLIRFLTKPLTRRLPSVEGESAQSLRNAGMYIGWLERSLVLTAVLMHSPATVGLVLAAKSIARFPEMGKSERFAEYFLIGTLLSLLGAIFGGAFLLKVLDGTVSLG